MPGFVGEVALLARGNVDFIPLRIRMRLQLCRAAAVVMDLHTLHGDARQVFDARPKLIGQARVIGLSLERGRCSSIGNGVELGKVIDLRAVGDDALIRRLRRQEGKIAVQR
jgi:hypothetical protein